MTKIKIYKKEYKNEKTKSGNWSTIKLDYTEEEVTEDWYYRFISNLWSDDRVYRTYTPLGYKPYRVTNTSPCGQVRAVYEFTIAIEDE